MSYDLIQFIADCQTSLKRDPGPAGREKIRANLERLLSNKDFVEKYCGDNVERGLKVLYEDPELKFQILAHINDKARDLRAARSRRFMGDIRPSCALYGDDGVRA